MKKIKRVAVYIRVSTDEQAVNGSSLEAQREGILKYVEQRTDEFVINKEEHIYTDGGYSGASDDRPALIKMINDAKNKKFDVILVWKVDRFFRKTLFLLQYVEELYKYGVGFKSITQDFDTSNSYGKMILGILGVVGELERDMIRERTISGKIQKARQGYFVGGGSSKFGFKIIKTDGGKKLEIDEDEKEVIKRIFDLFVNEKKSLGEISDILTEEKVKTKYDIEYENRESYDKMKPCHWHPSTVRGILHDTMYIGKYFYGKTYNQLDPNTGKYVVCYREDGDPQLVEMKCEKILEDDKIFYQAQELLEKNKETKNNKTPHIFTSYIVCGCCGRKYIGYRTCKGTFSYRCGGAVGKKLPKELKCYNPEVSELYLIDEIWKKITNLFNNPDKLLDSYYKFNTENSNVLGKYETELKEIEIKLNQVNLGITNVYSEFYMETNEDIKKIKQGVIDGFKGKMETLNTRKEELIIKIDKLKRVESNKENIKKAIVKFNKNLKGISIDSKKIELIKEFVDSIKIKEDGNLIISFRFDNGGGDDYYPGNNDDGNDDKGGGNDDLDDENLDSESSVEKNIPLDKRKTRGVKSLGEHFDVSKSMGSINTLSFHEFSLL